MGVGVLKRGERSLKGEGLGEGIEVFVELELFLGGASVGLDLVLDPGFEGDSVFGENLAGAAEDLGGDVFQFSFVDKPVDAFLGLHNAAQVVVQRSFGGVFGDGSAPCGEKRTQEGKKGMGEESMRVARPASWVYFHHYAAEGLLVTFVPHYLVSLGVSAAQIGMILGVHTGVSILAQPVLTRWSDRSGRARIFVLAVLVGTLMPMGFLPFATGMMGVAAAFWLQSVPHSGVVPLMDAACIRAVSAESYGKIRVWGSVGYGGVVASFGWFTRELSYRDAGALSVPLYLVCAAFALGAALFLPRLPAREVLKQDSRWLSLLRRPGLLPFVAINAVHWAAVMNFNVYLSIHTGALGLDTSVPGWCVLASVASEAVALRWMGRRVGRSPHFWMFWGFLGSALRWGLMSVVSDPWAVVALQGLNFCSFGVWLCAVMIVLGRFASDEERASVQGIFASVVFGVGGAAGIWVGGIHVEQANTSSLFGALTVLEVLAAAGIWFYGRAFKQRLSNEVSG